MCQIQGQLYQTRSANLTGLRSTSANGLVGTDSGVSSAMQASLDGVHLPRTPSLPSAVQPTGVLQHAGSFSGQSQAL